jgi:hypothetical protein
MATLQPYSDMLDWLARYLDFSANGNLRSYLLAPHNFHRLVWTFAAIAIDVRVFQAQGYALIGLDILCLAVATGTLAWIATRGVPKEQRLFVGGLAAMLTLMAANLLDASIPINGTYAQCLAFSLAAIVLADRQETTRRPAWTGFAALALLVAATLGSAVGFVVLPIMLLGAWQRRASRLWIGTLLVGGVCYAGLYAYGNSLGPSATWTGARVGKAIIFGLSYLGLPWTRVSPGLGLVIGTAVLALGVTALFLRGGRDATPSQRLATQLILFSLGTVLMAVIMRTDAEAPTNVPVRYSLLLAPLHVGLLALIWGTLAKLQAKFPDAAAVGMVLAAAIMLGQQMAMGHVLVGVTDKNRNLIADFRAGKRDPAMIPTVHWDLAHAGAIRARLDQNGLYQSELHAR